MKSKAIVTLADSNYYDLLLELIASIKSFEQSKNRNDIYDVLHDSSKIFDAIYKTNISELKLVPSTLELSGAEIELARQEEREVRLKNAIEKIKVQINNNHPHKQNPPLLGGAKYHPSDYETYEYSSILLDWMEI